MKQKKKEGKNIVITVSANSFCIILFSQTS